MGRRSISLCKEDIERALEKGTIEEASNELGVCRSTLVRRIREYGLGKGRGNYKRQYRRRKKHSLVHRKLVENSGAILPGDPVALSRILNVTPEEVRTYLSRGKRSAEKFIKEVLTKASQDIVLIDIYGDSIPIAAIAKMSVILDQWGRKVSIIVTSKRGSRILLKYKIKDLWGLLENK